MDKPLYIFHPLEQSVDKVLYLSLSVLVLSFSAGYYFGVLSKMERNRRLSALMIVFFIGAIAAGTTGFRLFSKARIRPIQLFTNRIETPYGIVSLTNIRDYYIKLERHFQTMNPTVVRDSARYFFLLERSDKTHVLSEGDYPIDSILVKMNELMGY
jgi:hypothetical protein